MGLEWKCVRVGLLAFCTFLAHGQERQYRALIIGNDGYSTKPLRWAVANAHAVEERLGQLGFELSAHDNVTKRQFSDALARFRNEIAPGDVVVFYYAGRATRSGEAGTLVPVDETEIAVRSAIGALEGAHPAATLVVLDVLAEQPVFGFDIGPQWVSLMAKPPAGTVIMASTRIGQTASGVQRSATLTGVLLDALRKPDISVAELVRAVRSGLEDRHARIGAIVNKERDRIVGVAPADIAFNRGADTRNVQTLPAQPASPPETSGNTPRTQPSPSRDRTSPTATAMPPGPSPPPVPAASSTPPAALTRFPTMEAPDSVSIGVPFSVLVSLTTEKVTPNVAVPQVGKSVGKTSDGALELNLPCQPKCDLEVVLTAPGFAFQAGANTAGIEMTADGDSTPAKFTLTALQAGEAKVEASFWHQGAFLARAVRSIQVVSFGGAPARMSMAAPAAAAPSPRAASVASSGPAAALPLSTGAPDLTVRWEESTVGTQQYCTVIVTSPHLGAVRSAPCVTGVDLARHLSERYRQVHELTARGVKVPGGGQAAAPAPLAADELRGLGRELYDHFATKPFQDAFWALVDKERSDPSFHFRTIQVYTNNPVLPWELLVPARADGSDDRGFLGAEFEVARWHIGDRVRDLPPLVLKIDHIVAFAPHYQGGSFLPHQREELESIRALPGYQESAGQADALLKLLDDPPEGIIHFAGHGFARAGAGGVSEYGLQFEDAALNPTIWRGHQRAAAKNHPLVVLNACETGGEQNVAGFIDGWAAALLETGASGFIGGIWPLGDQGAAEFAREFYEGLKRSKSEGARASVAELVRQARTQFNKTGDPTFLAYVFYGDARLRIE